MNKRILIRDFLLINIFGGVGLLLIFCGILLQKGAYLPSPPCAFLQATHMYCPGCGGTRALFAMLKGEIWNSICYNPAVVIGVVLVLYYEAAVILTLLSKTGRIYYCRKPWPVYVYIAIVLIFFIIRNVLLVGFGIDMLP